MMEDKLIFSQQELFFGSLLMEFSHSKKLEKTIIIINIYIKEMRMPIGKRLALKNAQMNSKTLC